MKAFGILSVVAVMAAMIAGAQCANGQDATLDTVKQYQAESEQAVLGMMEGIADASVGVEVAWAQTGSAAIESAIATVNAALNSGSPALPELINPQQARLVRTSMVSFRNADKLVLSRWQKAMLVCQNPLKTQRQKIAATKLLKSTHALAGRKLARWRVLRGESFVLLQEINAASAGFSGPGGHVCYRVQVYGDLGAIPNPVSVVVVNPASALGFTAVEPPADPIVLDLTTEKKFCVMMGSDLGGGRVDIMAGGEVLASRLLFNRGEKSKLTPFSGPFDGSYSGTFTGTAVYVIDGVVYHDPVGGGCGGTIYRTAITVTSPGDGHGRVAANGFARFTSGGGSLTVANARVTFTGTFEKARSGAVFGNGWWWTKFTESGVPVSASGPWNVTGP